MSKAFRPLNLRPARSLAVPVGETGFLPSGCARDDGSFVQAAPVRPAYGAPKTLSRTGLSTSLYWSVQTLRDGSLAGARQFAKERGRNNFPIYVTAGMAR